MTLDIEHCLKIRLLNAVENNPEEDGYRLIQKFLAQDPNFTSLKKIHSHKSSDYCKDLIEKYYPFFPTWVFIELISFGELAHLCEFYHKMYGEQIADRILLNSVRDIRNASAHSNCLINRLTPGNNNAHISIVNRIKKIKSIGEKTRDKKLSNKCLYDFVCLLYAYDEIVPNATTKRIRYKELNDFFTDRMVKNKDWFSKNDTIASSYRFAKKVLDNFLEV